jgi:hypothetical protein
VHDSERSYQLQLRWLKRWIWIYFWLLIFEGVLRKWIFPELSGPLLLIRDPVALIIYYRAYRCGKFSMRTMWPLALLAAEIVTADVTAVEFTGTVTGVKDGLASLSYALRIVRPPSTGMIAPVR